MKKSKRDEDESFERLLDACLPPHALGRVAASMILEHSASVGQFDSDGEIFRETLGCWVDEYLLSPEPHQIDLGLAVVNITGYRLTVRLYNHAKDKTGPGRLCLPATR